LTLLVAYANPFVERVVGSISRMNRGSQLRIITLPILFTGGTGDSGACQALLQWTGYGEILAWGPLGVGATTNCDLVNLIV
jgi:hypothetical protein